MSFNEFMVYFYAHIVNNTGLQACYVNIKYFVYSTFCVKYLIKIEDRCFVGFTLFQSSFTLIYAFFSGKIQKMRNHKYFAKFHVL